MGKIEEQQQQREIQGSESRGCSMGLTRIGRAFNFKCFFILILSAFLFLSALFWLPPFHAFKSGFYANDADNIYGSPSCDPISFSCYNSANVSFALVSILSMHQPRASNWTDVVFGVLSVPKNVPINSVSLSVLRSSLVDLVLWQSNLFLTTSIFGQPSSFEILKFHGGITVSPVQSVSIWQISQILFTFILYNSVSQIQENFDQFNEQLKFGLHLRSYEVTNKNGSTLAPPVTVQASILSGVGSHNLLPQRLKQLAQTITRSPPAKNLGLDHSVFGKVKEIMLSSLLNRTLRTSQGSPTPSPSPSEDYFSASSVSPYPAPPPSYAPAPSVDNRYLSPCIHCDTLSPSGNTFPYAPTPENGPQYPWPPISKSPSPSMMTTHSPRHGPCCGPSFSPCPFPTANSDPSAPSDFSPRAPVPHPPVDSMSQLAPNLLPVPAVSYGSNPGQDKRSGEASVSPLASLPISPSPSFDSLIVMSDLSTCNLLQLLRQATCIYPLRDDLPVEATKVAGPFPKGNMDVLPKGKIVMLMWIKKQKYFVIVRAITFQVIIMDINTAQNTISSRNGIL
ncbi:hypothetical protein HHK36_008993 [Tetracentron sinense]|uniref:DUF7036 domain-containing protein n=1 Tax=Tetracentron sinense TaxID=13715 RepID=A0A835DHY1_TETSI|nr:hypothetical protein HHK36_008993 [Tetracentron sinense]